MSGHEPGNTAINKPQDPMPNTGAPSHASAPVAANNAQAPSKPLRIKIIGAVFLLGAAFLVGRIWWYSHFYEETDNAYLTAHVSAVSSRVAGVVTRVLVEDNQYVRAGEVLVELDPADHQVNVDAFNAQIAQQDAQIQQINAQIAQASAEATAINEQIAAANAVLKKEAAQAARLENLLKTQARAVAKIEVDVAVEARDSAAAQVRAQRSQASAAESKIIALHAALGAANAQKKYISTQLENAQLQLSYNTIMAPVSGRVGRKSVELGLRLQPGQNLLAIVQDRPWVTANFKETQLRDLFVGQRASVRIDAFSHRTFRGHIESFSPASGAQFSLLPPDNATGNFTKIVQRVPVKIVLDSSTLGEVEDRLAPGMSAIVSIDLDQEKVSSVKNKPKPN